jgi:hypothetical protein
MPLHAAALAKQTVTRRPPRTVVLALGLAPGELEARLGEALARTDDPPERTLVVTDALELAPLMRAGVAFEHVPGRDSRQAELSGVAWEAFLARRLALILAERPAPRLALALGDTPAWALAASGAQQTGALR